jgi:hypothetical protein
VGLQLLIRLTNLQRMVMTPVSDECQERCEMEQDLVVAILGGSQQVIFDSKVSSHHGWQHIHGVCPRLRCDYRTLLVG